jgi:formylglycine-generating enzyme required for sulfatase activity
MARRLSETFGRYQILRPLGEGGMGSVYLARDTQLDRLVALKVPRLGDDDQLAPHDLKRFLREARSAAALSHPNLCPIHDVGEIVGTPYLTMAYLEGRLLSDLVETGQPIAQRNAALIVRKLAQAVQEAHSRGVIHRDLKPSNVMITGRGEPVVMDFGLARRDQTVEARLTKPGTALGTPAYMSPEQIRGEPGTIGPASDIYALGVILYELVTGRLPFEGSVLAILGRILTEDPVPPSRFRPDLDPQLGAICLKAMAKKVEDRYATMSDLAAALTAHLRTTQKTPRAEPSPELEPGARASAGAGVDPLATVPPVSRFVRPEPQPPRSGRRLGMRVAVAAAVAMLLGAAVTFPVWRPLVLGKNGNERLRAVKRAPLGPTAEEQAAESGYRQQSNQIVELKKQAEAVGTEIESEAKKSPGTVAEQIAELWRLHSQPRDWLARAEKSLGSAQGLAEQRSFDQAGAELKLAEAEYRKPQQWRAHARQALESIEQTRAAVQKQIDRFPPDSARLLLSWPEVLANSVEDKLLEGDGAEGLAAARRLAEQLPEIDKLFALRQDAVAAAKAARESAQTEEFRGRYEAAGLRVQEADTALVKARLSDARRLYHAAEQDYREILTALNEHLAGLLARGKAELDAGRFTAAVERSQAVLKIRPGDAPAAPLARRAEIGGRLARVQEHDRSGEREEALAALAELRRLAPEDADVRAVVNKYVEAVLAKGKEELAAERFDQARQEFQRIFKLRPGDATAAQAIQHIEVDRPIARVKHLNRSRDRGQALAALDDLRRLAPDDLGVKSLRDSIYDSRRAITNSIGMKLELIPAGEILMGSLHDDKDAFDNEKPQHRVRITRAFYLSVTEVTRGQFRRFVDEVGYRTEAEKDGKGGWGWNEATKKFEQNPRYTWQAPGFEQTDKHPVVNVSWNDVHEFMKWLSRKEGRSYRLPTEAEWEYACRAGTTTKYSIGDDPETLAAVGNIADGTAKKKFPNWPAIAARDGYVYTAPVGQFRYNGFGLYDMHGNVWEWCSDGYAADYYKRSPVDDPPGGVGGASARVDRGGSWFYGPRFARSAFRRGSGLGYRGSTLGFRLARSQPGR